MVEEIALQAERCYLLGKTLEVQLKHKEAADYYLRAYNYSNQQNEEYHLAYNKALKQLGQQNQEGE